MQKELFKIAELIVRLNQLVDDLRKGEKQLKNWTGIIKEEGYRPVEDLDTNSPPGYVEIKFPTKIVAQGKSTSPAEMPEFSYISQTNLQKQPGEDSRKP